MSFVIPVALQIHFFSKNKNDAGYMQEPNRTLLNIIGLTTAQINSILCHSCQGVGK